MAPPRRLPDPEKAAASAAHGRRGEDLAAELLRRIGYRIVARNLRTADAEIDLLVRRRRRYAAVEVKTRRAHPAPERMVDADRRHRLLRALRSLAPHLRPLPRGLRVDVVAVVLGPGGGAELRHFPGVEQPWCGCRGPRFWLESLWTI